MSFEHRTKKVFLMALGGTLAVAAFSGAGVPVAISGSAGSPAAVAEASSLYRIESDYARVYVPTSWKSFARGVDAQGHSSGAYHAGYTLRGNASYAFMRVEGTAPMPPQGGYARARVTGKSSARLTWRLRGKGAATAEVRADNVVLRAWNAAHGKSGGGLSKAGRTSLKRLVKTVTGGACTYSKVAKLSKGKAAKLGRKSVYKYMSKKVIPNVELLY